MHITWLGWAGAELGAEDGSTVVIDPVQDARAVFAPIAGEREIREPAVVPAQPGRAVAGMLSHLHRDHADAAALAAALAPGAPVLEPPAGDGEGLEELALVQAEHELAASGLQRRRVAPWETVEAGPFTLTALPAVDGFGDPQLSWLVEADSMRVLHLGDTMFHGFWWRMALRHGPFDVVLVPVNGTVTDFPHRQPASPLPAVLDPEQAAVAVELLGARLAVPIHAEGYEMHGLFAPVPGAAARFAAAAEARGVAVRTLALGETMALEAAA